MLSEALEEPSPSSQLPRHHPAPSCGTESQRFLGDDASYCVYPSRPPQTSAVPSAQLSGLLSNLCCSRRTLEHQEPRAQPRAAHSTLAGQEEPGLCPRGMRGPPEGPVAVQDRGAVLGQPAGSPAAQRHRRTWQIPSSSSEDLTLAPNHVCISQNHFFFPSEGGERHPLSVSKLRLDVRARSIAWSPCMTPSPCCEQPLSSRAVTEHSKHRLSALPPRSQHHTALPWGPPSIQVLLRAV